MTVPDVAREPARAAAPLPPERRAHLLPYAYWQLRDYLRERGVATVLVTMLFGWIGVAPMMAAIRPSLDNPSQQEIARYGSVEAVRSAMLHTLSVQFIGGFIGSMVFLAALLAMNGIVANDRKLGYYRFFFSKPVDPYRYYAQAFAVNMGAYLVLLSLMTLLYGALVTPVLTPAFLTGVAITFLLYAGIAFVLSAAARWDWLSLVAVTVAATLLWGMFGASVHPLSKLLYLLPPVHKTNNIYKAVAEGTALPWETLAWIGGYGAFCFAAGLLVLRHRRLAIL